MLIFSKNYFKNYQCVKRYGSRSGPDLGPNCLQRISAEDKSRRWCVCVRACVRACKFLMVSQDDL